VEKVKREIEMTSEQEKKKYDYIRNLYNASTRSNTGDLDMKSRQEKALEIRDLITQINARVSELEEDGFAVQFLGGTRRIKGLIKEVVVSKLTHL